jgi:HK97 family phage prohead protease
MTIYRKVVPAQVNTLGADEVEIIMSTAALARDGHILVPQGGRLDNYRSNPIILWQHDPEHPVGTASEVAISGDAIRAKVTFAPPGISAKADEIRGLVKAGIIRGVSIGFDPLAGDPLDPKRPRGGQRYTDWELLECSFCSVPVDTEAGVTARAETIPDNAGAVRDASQNDRSFRKLVQRMLTRDRKPKFKRGLYEVSELACFLERFGYIHSMATWEAAIEGDDSEVPGMLGEVMVSMGEALIAMTKEEVTELLDDHTDEPEDDVEIIVLDDEDRAYIAAGKTPRARAWRKGVALARAGKVLSSSNEKKLGDANDHLDRAVKSHKTLGEHSDAAGGHMDGITAAQEAASTAQDKVGDALDKAKAEPEKAQDHIGRAMKAHRAVGKQLDTVGEKTAALKDTHEDAADTHRAMGRSLTRAQRCVRSVVDGSSIDADDEDGDSAETETSDGTGDNDGEDTRAAVARRRRQADLLALTQH